MALYYNLVYIAAYIGLFATCFYMLSLFRYYKKKKLIKGELKSVSIIIPAYNEEKSIAKTIESALSLDYPAKMLEIIVVNDGSKDNTYNSAKKYESDKRVRVRVFSKENGGKGSALNYGIKKARGEIIVTMDADTFVEPSALSKMIEFFSEDRVMSVTPSMGIYQAKNIWQRIQQIEYYMGVFLRKAFASTNAIHITPGAFSAYRKAFFDKYGGYDEHNITEDLEIALRIQSHNYIIENASKAAVYTIAPKSFRELLVQRRRWYVGLTKNLWSYRKLFGFKHGALGVIVLPVAVITVIFSIFLTVYSLWRSISIIQNELITLSSINFHFNNSLELNYFVLQRLFYNIFSQPVFLIAFLFVFVIAFYMYFSRREMRYKEGIKVSFALFLFFYTFLFTFWWIISFIYVLFNRKVVWRESKDGK